MTGFAPFSPWTVLASPKPGPGLMLTSCQDSLCPQTFLDVTQAEFAVCSSRREGVSFVMMTAQCLAPSRPRFSSVEISQQLGQFPLKELPERGGEGIISYRGVWSDSHGAAACGVRTEESRVGRSRMRGSVLGFENLGGLCLGLALWRQDLS